MNKNLFQEFLTKSKITRGLNNHVQTSQSATNGQDSIIIVRQAKIRTSYEHSCTMCVDGKYNHNNHEICYYFSSETVKDNLLNMTQIPLKHTVEKER